MDLDLVGKTALVTGGSMGIGLETARCLAREGAKVLICARRESALAAAAKSIKETTGQTVETHPFDVTKTEEIAELPLAIERKLGDIDILVNNAGTGTYKPFLEVTDEDLQYSMAINFFAPFRICQKVIPLMLRKGGGRIINIAGSTGMMVVNPPFFSSCSGPAKSAEIRLSKILANEFAQHNIRVNCVVPGLVLTPERFAKWERDIAKQPLEGEEGEQTRKQWASNQGMRNLRWGTPEELANLIVFALSDAANNIRGAVLVADGGMDKS